MSKFYQKISNFWYHLNGKSNSVVEIELWFGKNELPVDSLSIEGTTKFDSNKITSFRELSKKYLPVEYQDRKHLLLEFHHLVTSIYNGNCGCNTCLICSENIDVNDWEKEKI